ncbi:MAG TPA: zinc-binding dehydrogenase [Planctomycetaceae bacterium]|nr:zinc-binding dehydrogenase [Planctomycetaceae bacterium]
MLAGHITAPGRIELIEVEEPRLPERTSHASLPGEIIFQPELACLCGSDIPFFEHSDEIPPPEIGHSLHEMIGRVVAANGSRFRPGERVLAVPVNQCGLFERFLVSEERAIPLDPRVPDEQAVLAQPLGTVIYALRKLPEIIDRVVAVVGQGPIGHLFNAALCNLGAREVVAIDRLASRVELSRATGATAVVCTDQQCPVEAVGRLTDERMADIVVEAVGHGDEAFNLCAELCGHAGRILYFGVPPVTIDGLRWRDVFFKNLTVHTSVNPDFGCDFPLAMRWIAEKRVNVAPLVTHRFPLSQIQTAFETFRDRREMTLKVLVDFPCGRSG